MRWLATLESRRPVADLEGAEAFAVGDGAVIRTACGDIVVAHDTGWSSLVVELPEHREVRHCRLVAKFPMRHYPAAADVYEDSEVVGVLHGTRCSRSLWVLALQGRDFLDPDFPTCQDLAAGGQIPHITVSDLAAGRW